MIEMLEKIILAEKEQDIKKNISELLGKLKSEIENYVKRYGWEIDADREKGRGSIFVKKINVTSPNDYEIGIEHFNFYYVENKQKRDDYIFCGRFYPKQKRWSRKKHITNYKGVKMRTNSQEYAGLLLIEDIDDLVSHFLEEFIVYFNNNKYY